jgi:IS6 family transposase
MSVFKRRRFPAEIILLCVRWYCRYGISYQDLEEMMAERGVAADHVTLYRWVQRYAPELEKRVRWYQGYRSSSWRVDETYVRVRGKWKYLFRAIDKHGRLIDFMLSDRRNAKAARRFLAKALKIMRNWPPASITTEAPNVMWGADGALIPTVEDGNVTLFIGKRGFDRTLLAAAAFG